jgi:hypothetical protein
MKLEKRDPKETVKPAFPSPLLTPSQQRSLPEPHTHMSNMYSVRQGRGGHSWRFSTVVRGKKLDVV